MVGRWVSCNTAFTGIGLCNSLTRRAVGVLEEEAARQAQALGTLR